MKLLVLRRNYNVVTGCSDNDCTSQGCTDLGITCSDNTCGTQGCGDLGIACGDNGCETQGCGTLDVPIV